eukprot:TRINITY_DN5083_c0_g1_i1.p1 TRINITY_DN5083_c0_g1~~TRINITY_DN5083_c0_g1_i1.p1  ORF type:complete len:304 (-),score=64.85 TRINITY_DN5083_c0_g1_i1:552-1463(-)
MAVASGNPAQNSLLSTSAADRSLSKSDVAYTSSVEEEDGEGFMAREEAERKVDEEWEDGEDAELVEDDDEDDDEATRFEPLQALVGGAAPVIRPGIVHRLDKGTSGLLVVAKDEYSHACLCDQFKARTVRRMYVSLTCGVPRLAEGRVEAPIGRDPRDRKRMAVVMQTGRSGRSRYAASRYRVIETLANGSAALVEWRLETGRTHQIRVHARHSGHPILGDEAYGGTGGGALALLMRGGGGVPGRASAVKQLMARLERPYLHAQTLGFIHPHTQEELFFTAEPPTDFLNTLSVLRGLSAPHSP